jgi:transposase
MRHIITFPELTGEQLVDLQRLLRSRSTPVGVHRRAALIWELAAGSSLGKASEAVGLHYTNAHGWVRRFLAAGVPGLADHTRSGRPPAYTAEASSEILKAATARPQDLGLGFTSWSLPKLEEYLRQQPNLKHLARSTIRRRLRVAGLRYLAGQTWCQSTDPDFEVKKPGGEPVFQPSSGRDRGMHGRNGPVADDSPRRVQLGPESRPTSRPL